MSKEECYENRRMKGEECGILHDGLLGEVKELKELKKLKELMKLKELKELKKLPLLLEAYNLQNIRL